MLACLAANLAALVWQRRGRATLSAVTYLLTNSVVLVIYAITAPNTNALVGLVVALGLAAYASATLPRRRVALGTLCVFASGAFSAALDYIQPWQRGRLNLDLASPTHLTLATLGLVFMLVRLYRGVPLNAKLLLAGGGLALMGAVVIFGPVYATILHLPPALASYGGGPPICYGTAGFAQGGGCVPL
jgi:hypothetical protein